MISSGLLLFITLTAIVECANFDPRQTSLANALQNILSPANTEKAMQIIQMAANRQIGNQGPCVEEKKLMPMGILQRSAPTNAGQYIMRQSPNIPVKVRSEIIPTNVAPIQNPIRSPVATPSMPIIVMASREAPQMNVVKEIMPQMNVVKEIMPQINPFLPAASPISAWSSAISNLSPAPTMSHPRGHFLRKIPIPPPTL